MKNKKRALTYQAILLLAASAILILDVVLAVLLYRSYISPSYTRNLYHRMQRAYETVQADPTGPFADLERENISVLVTDADGVCVYASLKEQRPQAAALPERVEQASVLPMMETSGDGDEGLLEVLGSSGAYYLCVSTRLDPIYAVAYTFLRYSILIGLVLWIVTALVIILVERQIFAPITEAAQVAKGIARQDFSRKCGSGGIARQSQELARSLNEMSDQLQEALEQLRQANRQLTEDIQTIARKEQAMKNLVANLSHDLKTPLALISGYAEGLSAGTAGTEAQRQEYCGIILDETERMRQMLTRMLELSRLESGQVLMQTEDFDLAELLEQIVNQFGLELEREQITLHREYPARMPVSADFIACDQVLTNLIQNAIYHSTGSRQVTIRAYPVTVVERSPAPPAPPAPAEPLPPRRTPMGLVRRVLVRPRRRSAPAVRRAAPVVPDSRPVRIRVEVRNTCAPIDPETMEHLFERFYRGEQSRRRAHGHMGLGLSIVRCNMELMDLPYGVSNVPGGVMFWVDLPAASRPPAGS